jgi:hypothetical protein
MSWDGRVRVIAREEVERVGRGGALDAARLQRQVTDLHEHLHIAATEIKRLADRVGALEAAADEAAAAAPESGAAAPARRGQRRESRA